MEVWKYIKARPFFRDYLPRIKNYENKMRGKNGRGNPLDFSEEEKEAICAAIEKMMTELLKNCESTKIVEERFGGG